MSNLKILKDTDGKEYYWSFPKAKVVLNNYSNERNIRKEQVYKEICPSVYVSCGAVKNWFTRKNGPDHIDQVKALGKYFGVPYLQLLQPAKEEMEGDIMDLLPINFDALQFDFRTIKFMDMIKDLCEKSKNGYIKFSEYTPSDREKIVYIDTDYADIGQNMEIVLDMCVDEHHHDCISTYNHYVENVDYSVKVEIDEIGPIVCIYCNDGMEIVIENGEWYCC